MNRLLWTATLTFTLAFPATPQMIDFETLPGGAEPVEGQGITDQYEADAGVRFQLTAWARDPLAVLPPVVLPEAPEIAEVGFPLRAFVGREVDGFCADQPANPESVGSFFLTDGGRSGTGLVGNLLVEYVGGPVRTATGSILDIDRRIGGAAEAWTVIAFDDDWNVLSSVVLSAPEGPDPPQACAVGLGPGDALTTDWVLEAPDGTATIHAVLVAYTGSPGLLNCIGLAFDNFSPSCSTAYAPLGRPCQGNTLLTGNGCALPSGTVRLSVDGGSPDALGCLVGGLRAGLTPLGPCSLLVGAPLGLLVPHRLNANGSAFFELPLPPTLSAVDLFVQGLYVDASGLLTSNGLTFQVAP